MLVEQIMVLLLISKHPNYLKGYLKELVHLTIKKYQGLQIILKFLKPEMIAKILSY